MPSLADSPHPLAFRVAGPVDHAPAGSVRVLARSLEGMQKEALVIPPAAGPAWRMASDEGPYLEGTDLAPFPLAFFTTGLAANWLSFLLPNVTRVVVDSRYSMTGSALLGTMRGEALPVELRTEPSLSGALSESLAGSVASLLLAAALPEEFGIRLNGQPVAVGGVGALTTPMEASPEGFDRLRPAPAPDTAERIIEKVKAAPIVEGAGGVGSSLAGEQKRTLHLRGAATRRSDGLIEVGIELFRPVGSSFRFLSDTPGVRAPSPQTYIAAGIAFCFLTQLGRYAHIVREPLDDYRIIQDLVFPGPPVPNPEPLRTQVFLRTPAGVEFGRKLVDMGAQTCFLHAAWQSPTVVTLPDQNPSRR